MDKKQIRGTAFHEAGHVAAQLYYRHAFQRVTIIENDECLGHVLRRANKRMTDIVQDKGLASASDKQYLEHELIISMAGGISEMKFVGEKDFNEMGSTEDYKTCVNICFALGMSGPVLEAYLKYIYEAAKALLDVPEIRLFVEELVEILLSKKTLNYSYCKKLYEEKSSFYFLSAASVRVTNVRPKDWPDSTKI